MELRDLIEAGINIWDFTYPSFYKDEAKSKFEQKVIDHFYFRQIGQETPERFKHYFRCRVQEIMPYYCNLYKTVEIMNVIEDPFANVDVREEIKESTMSNSLSQSTSTQQSSSEQQSSSTQSATSDGRAQSSNEVEGSSSKTHIMSDTPRGTINNIESYMTNAETESGDSRETTTADTTSREETNGSGSSRGSGSSSGSGSSRDETENSITKNYVYTKKGNQGVNTYAHDMIEYRQTILNIDEMIIKDLNCLFLGVY